MVSDMVSRTTAPATTTNMLSYIQTATSRLCQTALDTRQILGDKGAIYEAFLFTSVLEALDWLSRNYNVTVMLQYPASRSRDFILKKKACDLAPAAGKYAHVRIQIGNQVFELHNDILTNGCSGPASELDVVVLDANVCDRIRQAGNGKPCYEDVVLLIEAKCYSGTLDLKIGREFLGLYQDFKRPRASYLVTSAQNPRIYDLLRKHKRTKKCGFYQNLDMPRSITHKQFIKDVGEKLRKLWGSRLQPRGQLPLPF
jgi:hypothetical protein